MESRHGHATIRQRRRRATARAKAASAAGCAVVDVIVIVIDAALHLFVGVGLAAEAVDLRPAGDAGRAKSNGRMKLRQMVPDLESLDATILQFEPDFQCETIKPKAFRPPKD